MALPISKITGVGPHTVNVLMEHGYTSVESIANTKIVDLTQVPGFGIARASNIIAAAKTLLASDKSESGTKAKKEKAKKQSKKKKGTKKKDKKATKKTKKEEKIKTKKKTSSKDKKKKGEKAKKKKKASTKKKK